MQAAAQAERPPHVSAMFVLVVLACDTKAALSCRQMRGRQAALICRKTPSLKADTCVWLLVCSALDRHLLPPTDELLHVAFSLHVPWFVWCRPLAAV